MKGGEFQSERKRMVADQITARGIREQRLLVAMGKVLRHRFIPIEELIHAYSDGPLPIGHGQTISQPYIVALMTDLLRLRGDEKVLEIGTGSGYQAAVLAELVNEVYTVEFIPELMRRAEDTLSHLGYLNVHVHLADGSLGWPQAAPYDGILVAACAPEVPPPLFDQLAEGGRLVAPIGSRGFQQLEVWERKSGRLVCQRNVGVAFVPLRGKFGWD